MAATHCIGVSGLAFSWWVHAELFVSHFYPIYLHLYHGLECLGPHAVLFVSPLFTMSPIVSKLCPTGLLFVLQLSSRSWVPSPACFAHCLPLDTDLSPAWHSFDFNLFATFLLGDGYLEPYLGRLAFVSHLFTICFQNFSGLSPDFQLTCLPLGSHLSPICFGLTYLLASGLRCMLCSWSLSPICLPFVYPGFVSGVLV